MSTEPISVGIIGITGFGDTHYRDLVTEVEKGRFAATAATVINQDEVPEKCEKLRALGCEIFDDHKAMLSRYEGKLDLCMIPTGIHLHAPMTIDAVKAGANVYVEKPAAATIQDVDAMMAAAGKAKRFVAVGYQRIYDPVMMDVKKRIIRGDVGRIETVSCQALWPRDDAYYGRNGWAGRLKSGDAWVLDSPYNNALSHDLAMICFLTGASLTSSVAIDSVQAELYHAHDIESADTCAIRIKTVLGPEMLYAVTHATATQSGPTMRFKGQRGSIVLSHRDVTIDVRGRGVETLKVRGSGQREAIRDALYKRCRGEDAFICDLGIARAQTLVVNAAHQAAPVRAIDASFISRVERDDRTLTAVAGIDEAIAKCADEMKLFSEIGVSWARPSKEFSVHGYESFGGVASD